MTATIINSGSRPFIKNCDIQDCRHEQTLYETTRKTAAIMGCLCGATVCEEHAKTHECPLGIPVVHSEGEFPDDTDKTVKVFQDNKQPQQ